MELGTVLLVAYFLVGAFYAMAKIVDAEFMKSIVGYHASPLWSALVFLVGFYILSTMWPWFVFMQKVFPKFLERKK